MTQKDLMERIRSGKVDRQRILDAITTAEQNARKSTYSAMSPTGAILILMDGEFKTKKVAIHPESYEHLDADSLADQVILAHNLARKAVNRGHLQHVLNRQSK